MKDINSVLAMSRHETDPQDCGDIALEMTCSPNAGMLEVDTQASFVNTSTVSVMDWAGCLIEMAISASDCDSENNVVYSFAENLDSREPTQAKELQGSKMAVTSPADLIENSLQNDNQRPSFEFGSTVKNSDDISLRGYLPADVTSCRARSSSQTNIDPDFNDPCLLTSLTDTTVADQHKPPPSGCFPTSLVSDRLKYSYADHVALEDSMMRPRPVMPEISHGSQYQLDNLPASGSDPLTRGASASPSSVGLELDTSSAFTISSTQSAGPASFDTNTSLETPILETCPDFNDTKAYSIKCSGVSNMSDSYPNLCSPTEPHLTDAAYYEFLNDPSFGFRTSGHLWDSYDSIVAGELTLPEIDIATVEIISSDSRHDSAFHHSQDDIPSHLIINPNTESLYQQNSIACSLLQGNDSVNITVYTIETPEASTSHSPQSSSTEHCIDASITHAMSSHIQIPDSLRQELPSQSIVTHLARDLAHPPTTQHLGLDFLSRGVDGSNGQDSYTSLVSSSRLLDVSVPELSIDNLNEYRGYCSDRGTRSTSLPGNGEGQVVDAARSPSTLHTQSRAENYVVLAQTKHSRKRRFYETTTSCQNPLHECPTFPSANPGLRTTTAPKLRKEQKQSRQPSWAHTTPSFSWESTDMSLSSDFDNLDGNVSDNFSNMFPSPSSSIPQNRSHTRSLLPQTSRHSPLRHQTSSEMMADALLTPSDLYNPFLGFESAMSSDATQYPQHKHRTVSDASEVSVEGSDLSNTLPTTPVSCTEGEGSQGPLTADKVKDTLRSKLKAKQETAHLSCHTGSLSAEGRGKLSQTVTGKSSPTYDDFSVTSVVTWSSGQSMGPNPRPGSSSRHSPASYMSPDESTGDNDTMNDEEDDDEDDDDDDDELSLPPAGRKRKDNQREDKDEATEESEGSRVAKREKNRLAAQKCRLRRRDRIETLTQQVQKLEQKQERIKTEVDNLDMEREQLEELLRLHAFVCKRKL